MLGVWPVTQGGSAQVPGVQGLASANISAARVSSAELTPILCLQLLWAVGRADIPRAEMKMQASHGGWKRLYPYKRRITELFGLEGTFQVTWLNPLPRAETSFTRSGCPEPHPT